MPSLPVLPAPVPDNPVINSFDMNVPVTANVQETAHVDTALKLMHVVCNQQELARDTPALHENDSITHDVPAILAMLPTVNDHIPLSLILQQPSDALQHTSSIHVLNIQTNVVVVTQH